MSGSVVARRAAVTRRDAITLAAGVVLAGALTCGAAAEPGTHLVDAAGLRAALETRRGMIVLVNFWATWCVPCLREIPDLQRLEAEIGPRGFALLAIAMDEPAEIERVEAFRRRHFPQLATWLRSSTDMDAIASVLDPAWNEILPTSWLVGRDGKVIRRVQGRRSHAEFRAMAEAVLGG